jgi:ABC-type oligopeptide transport system substrate-binding subunit
MLLNKKKLVAGFASVAIIAGGGLSLSSCGENDTSSSAKLAADQVLHITAPSTVSTFDQSDLRNTYEVDIIGELQEPLFRVFHKGDKDTFDPAGATKVVDSEDGLTHTLTIRDNFKWSDGKEVTAQDYADYITRTLDPRYNFSPADSLYWIEGAEEYNTQEEGDAISADTVKATATGDKTLVVTSIRPVKGSEVSFSAIYPVRKELSNEYNDYKSLTAEFGLHPEKQVYSGPFKVNADSFDKDGTSLQLNKNDGFWDSSNVKITEVDIDIVEDSSVIETLFTSGQSDVVEARGKKVPVFEKLVGENVKEQKSTPGNVSYLLINEKAKSGYTKSAKIRQALSLALDRDAYNKVSTEGYSKVAKEIASDNQEIDGKNYRKVAGPILDKYIDEYSNNKDKLQALFKEGLAELGLPTDLDAVHLSYLTNGETADSHVINEFITQNYEKNLGIHVDFDIAPDRSTFIAKRDNQEYDLSSQGWQTGADPTDQVQLWTSSYGFSKFFGNYNSPEYDAIWKELSTEGDVSKRFELIKKLEEQVLTKDWGTIPTEHTTYYRFSNAAWNNLQVTDFGLSFEYSRAFKEDK